jgi:hypothetical protein
MTSVMRRGVVVLLGLALSPWACRGGEERRSSPAADAGARSRTGEEPDPPAERASPPRPASADPSPLPEEASLGGAPIRIEILRPSRTLDRIAALTGALRRGASGGLASLGLPPEAEVRSLLESGVRATLFGRLLGIPDPSAVDLERPIRVRILPYGAGAPFTVVSFGTVRPLEASAGEGVVVRPDPDGRGCRVGLGVAPEDGVEEALSAASDEDLRFAIDLRASMEAFLGAVRRLTGLASLGEEGPWPPWLERFMLGQIRFSVEAAGIERMEGSLALGDGSAAEPMRFRIRLRSRSGPAADAWTALSRDAPPFGLLDSLDAGADQWGAVRMNPAAAEAWLATLESPVAAALAPSAASGAREPLAALLAAVREVLAAGDGRAAFAARTLPGGESRFTVVLGAAGPGMRAALRHGLEALAGLARAASAEYGLGADVAWLPAAEDVPEATDRLVLVVPRSSLGSAARWLRPGGGDLRLELSAGAGSDRAVLTDETDPERLRRALDARGAGGGPHGAAGAERLGRLPPEAICAGNLDLLAGARADPTFPCPGASPVPAMPGRFDLRVEPDGTLAATLTIGAEALAGIPALLSAVGSCDAAEP